MKKRTWIPLLLLLAASVIVHTGCSDEPAVTGPVAAEQAPGVVPGDGVMGAPQAIPINPVRLRPDLVITSYSTSVTTISNNCGTALPDVSCLGGERTFTATVTIRNNGPAPLPAGSFWVRWFDSVGNPQDQLVQHNGIPAGGTIQLSRPYWMGPCDCAPPPTTYTRTFWATVDALNQVSEMNEHNNTSPRWTACDGC